MLEHQDLSRRFSQLHQDTKVLKKSLNFRNLQVFELEELIGSYIIRDKRNIYLYLFLARKERDLEHLANEKISKAYQLPADIVQAINKLRVLK